MINIKKCDNCGEKIDCKKDLFENELICPACSAANDAPEAIKNRTIKVKKKTSKTITPVKNKRTPLATAITILLWLVLVGASVSGLAFYIKPFPENKAPEPVEPVVNVTKENDKQDQQQQLQQQQLEKEFTTAENLPVDNYQQVEMKLCNFTELFKKAVLSDQFKIANLTLDQIGIIQTENGTLINTEKERLTQQFEELVEKSDFAGAATLLDKLNLLGTPSKQLAQMRQRIGNKEVDQITNTIEKQVQKQLKSKQFDDALTLLKQNRKESDLAPVRQYCNERILEVCSDKNTFHKALHEIATEFGRDVFNKKYKAAAKFIKTASKQEDDKEAKAIINNLYKNLKLYCSFNKKLMKYLTKNMDQQLSLGPGRNIVIKKVSLKGKILFINEHGKKQTWTSLKRIPLDDYLAFAGKLKADNNQLLKALLCLKRRQPKQADSYLNQMPFEMGTPLKHELKQVVRNKRFASLLRKHNLVGNISRYSTQKAVKNFKNVTLNKKLATAVIIDINAFLRKHNDSNFLQDSMPVFEKINYACRKSGIKVQYDF